MSIVDGFLVALFGMLVVFVVLLVLSLLVKIQTFFLGIIAPGDKREVVEIEGNSYDSIQGDSGSAWASGELKLIGVDERTAAMIMAIVSHESQIPLSQLQFKAIKAID